MIQNAIIICFVALVLVTAAPPVAKSLDRVFAGVAFHLPDGAPGHHG